MRARRRVHTALLTTATVVASLLPGALAAQGQISLDLSNTVIAFPTPGAAHFDTGWVEHPGLVVSVQSTPANRPWELRIRADDPSLGGYGKPVSEVQWRREGTAVWTPLATTDAAVFQTTGHTDVTIFFRMMLSWDNDVPGSYSAGITLTAVRQ